MYIRLLRESRWNEAAVQAMTEIQASKLINLQSLERHKHHYHAIMLQKCFFEFTQPKLCFMKD